MIDLSIVDVPEQKSYQLRFFRDIIFFCNHLQRIHPWGLAPASAHLGSQSLLRLDSVNQTNILILIL